MATHSESDLFKYPQEKRALELFYAQGLITDVLRIIKTGKEASVYCCRAGGGTGRHLLAAKIYRPPEYRSFRNDALYQEGRHRRKTTVKRALAAKSHMGRHFHHELWIQQEKKALTTLYRAGLSVPQVVEHDFGALLMEYVGDEGGAAETLQQTDLTSEEAAEMFPKVILGIEIMLRCNWVHADLSPYNILVRNQEPVFIDFPQAVDARFNLSAERLLTRDVSNVCRFFARHGVEADAWSIASRLWHRYQTADIEFAGEGHVEVET